jgi:tetratricopeptide (TPR) repeat protein
MTDLDLVAEAGRLHEHASQERLAGRPADALPGCLDALAILERELGASSPDVAGVLNTVGAIREDLSEYGEAEACYRRAAETLDGIEGDDEVLVRLRVQTLANLAGIERVQGRLDDAERLFLEALELAEAAFDPDGRELASLRNNLAMVYKYAARFDEAEALYRRAVTVFEAALGPDHYELGVNCNNLGVLKAAQGDVAEAEALSTGRRYGSRSLCWVPTTRTWP